MTSASSSSTCGGGLDIRLNSGPCRLAVILARLSKLADLTSKEKESVCPVRKRSGEVNVCSE